MSKKLHELGQLIVGCEVYIVHQNRVLMHKRAADKSLFPGYWIGPGGHVEADEDALSAAIREIKEETGVTLMSENVTLKVLAFHHHLDRKEVWMEYLFRAEIPSSQPIHSTDEGETKWIAIDELMTLDNIFPPSQYYLEHILDKQSGILFNSSSWKNANLVQVHSQSLEKNSTPPAPHPSR